MLEQNNDQESSYELEREYLREENINESLAVSDAGGGGSEDEAEDPAENEISTISFYNEDTNEYSRSNKLNFALSNARSVIAKLDSLVDMFSELNLHFMLITETWLNSSPTHLSLIHI